MKRYFCPKQIFFPGDTSMLWTLLFLRIPSTDTNIIIKKFIKIFQNQFHSLQVIQTFAKTFPRLLSTTIQLIL